MKTKASRFFKQMVSTIMAVVKAKSTAMRVKTSALKTRFLILGILRNKKLLAIAINHKIHSIMGQNQQAADGGDNKDHLIGDGDGDDGGRKAIVLYTAPSFSAELGAHEAEAYPAAEEQEEEEKEDDDADDYLTHSLFAEEDDELVSAPGSVIDVMRGARERDGGDGADFRLEDEIDHVADVFIRRIHHQLKLQKLDSFKRFCEMLERGA